jgi:hypothetical protein
VSHLHHNRAEKALLDECGLTEADLQALLMANQENPEVQRVFMAMQVRVASHLVIVLFHFYGFDRVEFIWLRQATPVNVLAVF